MSAKNILIFILIIFFKAATAWPQQTEANGMQVKYLYDSLRFEQAIESGRNLLQSGKTLDRSDLIRIHQYMAYSFYNLSQLDSARTHFLTLLSLDSHIELDPIRTSPKIIEFFKEVRREFNQLKQNERLVPVKEYVFVEDARPSAAWRSAILPGWGQYYKNQKSRAYWLGGAFIGGLAITTAAWLQENKYKDLYLQEQNPAYIPDLYDQYNGWSKTRRVAGYFTVAVWLASFADALWSDYPRLEVRSEGNALSLYYRF